MKPPVDFVERTARVPAPDRTDEVLGWVIAAVAGAVFGAVATWVWLS